MTTASEAASTRPEPTQHTWSRVAHLVRDHPEVKQVRLERNVHGVTVGFYEPPSDETLERIKAVVEARAGA